ncbi:glycosyltransferase family 2 protein [Bradyrhizobium erythrophlei]|uniref:Cellulose synthase (UDP-forming) n=1 Tax=Bradyrhizobium erythrophlei TaxID=1437360 RepID=A0A1M5L1M7_9BRAD|nr:cellulose synthase catalytic subunit [Bradyrhizobium erythrophlei]SHG58830.1 cellulose synthase (UDP-forming) [Bradyrhizobium erythrophlei]
MFESAADNSSILSIDLGLLIGLLVMGRLLDPLQALDRILFGSTAGALLMMYALWRWHDTLPTFAFSIQILWEYFFFALEALAIVYTLMSIVILFRNIDRSGQADAAQSRMEHEGDFPPVDVFICTYDEPLEILERSVLTALALDYPTATVWVLDDTRRKWLREYCEAVGARYVTRDNNRDAKAGNLNNGLAVTAAQTNAPLILVLDADFAPRPDFLKRTVGLLSNPDVAVVQTPQFYYNPDPIQHNLLAAQSWVDDQRFFFDVFQPAKDAWGCAFCVGTSFVVRRDRLTEIGGFPSQAISEDINLTYTMLANGYQTWWLNEKLSIGLSAEGIPEYITQRARWCLGTIQVALLRDGPLFGSGFTFTQRWHYLHGVLNWFCKPFLVLLLIAPPIYWFAGMPAFETNYLSFLRYGVPALLSQIIYMAWISRSRTLPFFMEATHAVTAFAVTVTLLSAAVKPFGRPFKVTDKGGDRSAHRTHWKLASVFGLISLSSAVSIVWAFVSPYAASEISSLDFFNLLWAGIAMLIAFIAFLVCFELPRGEALFAVDEAAILALDDDVISALVTGLSTSTAQISLNRNVPARLSNQTVQLYLDALGWIEAEVSSCSEAAIGLCLRPTLTQHQQLVVRLFGTSYSNVADTASMSGAILGMLSRGFRGH